MISKLKKGQIVKNYKEMCILLEEKILSGKSKRRQLVKWKRYFDFRKDGHKFLISEIYETPTPNERKKREVIRKQYNQFLVQNNVEDLYGVYKISLGNVVYIGSTTSGFRKRFLRHFRLDNNNPDTLELLNKGAIFEVLWATTDNCLDLIRNKEYEYIRAYSNIKNITLVNKRLYFQMRGKSIYKKRNWDEKISIKIFKRDKNKVKRLLSENKIEFDVMTRVKKK